MMFSSGADHFVEFTETKLGHQLAHFLHNEVHEVDDVLRVTRKLCA